MPGLVKSSRPGKYIGDCRSLLAPACIALLIAAFADIHSNYLVWVLLVLAPFVWPALATGLTA